MCSCSAVCSSSVFLGVLGKGVKCLSLQGQARSRTCEPCAPDGVAVCEKGFVVGRCGTVPVHVAAFAHCVCTCTAGVTCVYCCIVQHMALYAAFCHMCSQLGALLLL